MMADSQAQPENGTTLPPIAAASPVNEWPKNDELKNMSWKKPSSEESWARISIPKPYFSPGSPSSIPPNGSRFSLLSPGGYPALVSRSPLAAKNTAGVVFIPPKRPNTTNTFDAPSPARQSLTQANLTNVRNRQEYAQRPRTVPIISRQAQLGEVADVQRAFETIGMKAPVDLNNVLVTPQDKVASECASNLPIPGSGLRENPYLKEKLALLKPKKKGKKGGKKKKK